MSPLERRAKESLAAALVRGLDEPVRKRMITPFHTQRLQDNLVPYLTIEQATVLRRQLATGDGGELRADAAGVRNAHAAHSSAALALNAFGPWLGREASMQVAGVAGFTGTLEVEAKKKINQVGSNANIDVWCSSKNAVLGIESKLLEPYRSKKPTGWPKPYERAGIDKLLEGGWLEVFHRSKQGWEPKSLDVKQLIKHALAINSMHPEVERHLVYCYWEPANADQFPEVDPHREDLATVTELLRDGEPRFQAEAYHDLFAKWDALDIDWVKSHVGELRRRYEIAV